MSTNQETLALQRQQPDEFLALIEKVVMNPEVNAEKLKVIVELKLGLVDREAEEEFDAAMLEAQEEVEALPWDKINTESASKNRYVSYKRIDKMLRPIRKKYGFSQSYDTEPGTTADMPFACCDVTHVTIKNGVRRRHKRRYRLPMPIDAAGPKGGGVMTKPQAVSSGMSYMMRKLSQMIWNIPFLIDADDNDGNPPKGGNVNEKQVSELRKLFDRLSEPRQRKALEHFKLDIPDKEPLHTALANLQAKEYNNALKTLATVLRNDNTVTITEEQEATLTALIEEIGGNCKADFLKTNKIKKVSELAASQYQGALAGLQQRRK